MIRVSSDRLRHEAAIRGWDQRRLAREAGVSEGTISRALAGNPIRRDRALRCSSAAPGTAGPRVGAAHRRPLRRGAPAVSTRQNIGGPPTGASNFGRGVPSLSVARKASISSWLGAAIRKPTSGRSWRSGSDPAPSAEFGTAAEIRLHLHPPLTTQVRRMRFWTDTYRLPLPSMAIPVCSSNAGVEGPAHCAKY